MSTDWESALAEVDEAITMLQATREGIKYMIARSGGVTGAQRVANGQGIPADAFLTMTIPDAARKFLEMVRSPQTIAQIWEALKQGGLPHTKYNAVYTAIWRRESPDGEFARPDDKNPNLWGLAAWYPTNPNIKKKPKAPKTKESAAPKDDKARSVAIPRKREGGTILDACEQILRDEGKPLHATVLVEKLLKFDKHTNVKSIAGTLPQDRNERFENLGRNTWALAEWSPAQKKLPLES